MVCQSCRFQKCITAGMSKGNSCFGRRSISFKLNHLLPAMLDALQNVQAENEHLHETYFTIRNLIHKSINTDEAIRNFQSIIERQKNFAISIPWNRQVDPAESRSVADEREVSPRGNVTTDGHPEAANLDLLTTLREFTFNLKRMQKCIQNNDNQSIEQTEPLDLSVRGKRHKLRTPSN